MKICGNDGEELRCCKTGLTIHDERFTKDSRHQADLYFCPVCKSLHIERNDRDYFTDSSFAPHCIIGDRGIFWDDTFRASIKQQYDVILVDRESQQEVHKKIMRAIELSNANNTGCPRCDFVGSPGDIHPPEGTCDACIDAGFGWRYKAYEVKPSEQQIQAIVKDVTCKPEYKQYAWGGELYIRSILKISLMNQGTMYICSNLPTVLIGPYIFNMVRQRFE